MASTPVGQPISGQPYPTLSGKPGTTVWSNPPFDSRILAVGGANQMVNPTGITFPSGVGKTIGTTENMERGKMITGTNKTTFGDTNGVIYAVNFLYNPSTIQETRSIDLNSGQLPNAYRDPGDPGQYMTGLSTNISFSLLFDRTYEVWDTDTYFGKPQGTLGCRVDIEALYNLLGINYKIDASNIQPPPGSISGPGSIFASTSYGLTVQGPMKVAPCQLFFGSHNTNALSYYGFISEIDITWTHFNWLMVPVRCAVQVSFTVLPVTTSNYVSGLQ